MKKNLHQITRSQEDALNERSPLLLNRIRHLYGCTSGVRTISDHGISILKRIWSNQMPGAAFLKSLVNLFCNLEFEPNN